jgi:hypothetical protein
VVLVDTRTFSARICGRWKELGMLIEFDEHVDLPAERVYPYFRSPRDWTRLYGAFGEVEERGQGWYAVPLRRFPFPLVARVVGDEPNRRVAWIFGGFWSGEGEVSFVPTDRGVAVRGYERISLCGFGALSRVLERLFLERRFRRVWESGWRRLRREAEELVKDPRGQSDT